MPLSDSEWQVTRILSQVHACSDLPMRLRSDSSSKAAARAGPGKGSIRQLGPALAERGGSAWLHAGYRSIMDSGAGYCKPWGGITALQRGARSGPSHPCAALRSTVATDRFNDRGTKLEMQVA